MTLLYYYEGLQLHTQRAFCLPLVRTEREKCRATAAVLTYMPQHAAYA